MLNINADLIFEFLLGLVQARFEQLTKENALFNAYLFTLPMNHIDNNYNRNLTHLYRWRRTKYEITE